MLLSTAVMCSVLFFVSLYLQTARGYSPLGTGAAFLPMTGLILIVAPLAGRLTDRLGSRLPATAGMLMLALGLLLLSEFGLGGGLDGLLPSLAVVGLGVGLVTTPVTATALAGVADAEAGVAAGVLNTARMIGLTLGIALMGAIVAARWPGGFAAAPVDPDALAGGLALAYRVNAVIALATAALAAATLPGSKPRRAMPAGGRAAIPATAPHDR
jgi:MFS family permease